ncbi:hypothetical protein TNCV_4622701 [Trichonephila clavipes]|nr:hypothetical protein TNCV_4622701 [Trichonephila clavipes]
MRSDSFKASYCRTLGPLRTAISSLSQVMKTTPELAYPSSNYPINRMILSLRRFNVYQSIYTVGVQGHLDSNLTLRQQVRDHSH